MATESAVRYLRAAALRQAREQLADDDLLLKVLEAGVGFVDAPHLVNLRERCLAAPAGAFVECGVAQGASLVVMAAYGDDRIVWGFDSFEGLPELSDADDGSGADFVGYSCSGDRGEQSVRDTFAAFSMPMRNVRLVKGWFADTLASTDTGPIAVLRLDADFYEATRCALETMVPRVVRGGFILIDDYYSVDGCRKAVDEYRAAQGIGSPLVVTDRNSEVWWTA
jgi:O-methyltransferase